MLTSMAACTFIAATTHGSRRGTRSARRPNKGMNRSAGQRRLARCSVPVALRAPAPGYAQRWASLSEQLERAPYERRVPMS
jgi:hypothetical protein